MWKTSKRLTRVELAGVFKLKLWLFINITHPAQGLSHPLKWNKAAAVKQI